MPMKKVNPKITFVIPRSHNLENTKNHCSVVYVLLTNNMHTLMEICKQQKWTEKVRSSDFFFTFEIVPEQHQHGTKS